MKKRLCLLAFILTASSVAFCQSGVFKWYPSAYYERFKADGIWGEWKEATTEFIKSNLIVYDFDNKKINMYSEKGVKEFTIVKVTSFETTDERTTAGFNCIDQSNKECILMMDLTFKGDRQSLMYVGYNTFNMKFVLKKA